MKIYRFLPDARHYGMLARPLQGPFWPRGIDLGAAIARLHPPIDDDAAKEGCSSFRFEPEAAPHSDFPALSLQVPIVSERALAALQSASLIGNAFPISASGIAYYAVQPVLSSRSPRGASLLDARASRGLALPHGEIYHYFVRAFEPESIPGEFFTIPELEPYSELYVTQRFVDVVRAADLTGLDYVELVFDGGPVQPVYQAQASQAAEELSGRYRLEHDLLQHRCTFYGYTSSDAEAAIAAAVAAGHVCFEYVHPRYERPT